MRIVALIALTAAMLRGASSDLYVYEKSTSLSGTAEVITVHLPAGSSKTLQFVGASVYCSVACTVTLERDGTAPTGTAGTVLKLNAQSDAAAAAAYYSSDVGTSTVIKTYTIAAGAETVIDLKEKGARAGENLTLRTSSITGTARIFFQWRQR